MSKYKPYPKYKDSGIEWLGDVPEGWEVLKLRRFTFLNQGLQISQSKRFYELTTGRIEYITIKSIHGGKNYASREYINIPHSSVICSETDILMARTGATGEVVTNVKGVFHNNFFKINYDENRINRYFYVYFLQTKELIEKILLMAGTTTIPDLNHGDFLNIDISLPPKNQQIQIATYLDQKTKKIDTLIKKQQTLITLLKEKRQALISHTVTKGLDDSVVMKIKKVKFNLTLQNKKTTIIDQEVIALENIESKSGNYIKTDSNYKGEDVAFKKGDILFGKLRPYLAKVFKCKNDGVAFGDLLVFRPNKEMDSNFVFYVMLSDNFISIVDSSTYGTKMPRASVEFINEMQMLTPPLKEQTKIANYLDQKTKDIDTFIKKSNKAIELLKERRVALVSAVVTGKVDVRGENL